LKFFYIRDDLPNFLPMRRFYSRPRPAPSRRRLTKTDIETSHSWSKQKYEAKQSAWEKGWSNSNLFFQKFSSLRRNASTTTIYIWLFLILFYLILQRFRFAKRS